MRSLKFLAVAAAALSFSTAASASIDYTLTNTSQLSSSSGSSWGNSMTFEVGGVSVKVTGWSLTGSPANSVMEDAKLYMYSGNGLGVCSRETESPCYSPEHQVDNDGRFDFALFEFDQDVDFNSLRVQRYCSCDADVSYFIGSAVNVAGKSLAQLTALFGGEQHDLVTSAYYGGPAQRTIGLTGTGRQLLVGGLIAPVGNNGIGDDYFKIQALSVDKHDTPPPPHDVPEPAALGLMGLGLVGLAGLRRRRKAA